MNEQAQTQVLEQEPQYYQEDSNSHRPFMSHLAIDETIIKPDFSASKLTYKKPIIVRTPIYLLDEQGEKIPILVETVNEQGEPIQAYDLTENGEIKYIIKDYIEETKGWETAYEDIPSVDIITKEASSTYIDERTMWAMLDLAQSYEIINNIQRNTEGADYALTLKTTANYFKYIAILNKSLNGRAMRIVKTNINKNYASPLDGDQQEGFFGNITKALFGGPSKKSSEL